MKTEEGALTHGKDSSSVSYGSSSHIDTHVNKNKKDEDSKIRDSGDGSFVHIDRGKKLQDSEKNKEITHTGILTFKQFPYKCLTKYFF